MSAGAKRHKIEWQKNTPVRDQYGEPIDSWESYFECHAEYISGAGVEKVTGQQITGRGVAVFRCWYRNPEPAIKDRVKFKGRVFDINDVDNPGARNIELLLTCTEVTG